MKSIDELLGVLDKVHPCGSGRWSARCPAHDDRSPSLSLKIGEDGRVLLYCFAGCSVQAVCAALGISVSDLFPDQSRGNRPLEFSRVESVDT